MLLTIDSVAYDHKPTRSKDIPAITRRMQRAGAVEAEPLEVAQLIADGVTWCGGCFEPNRKGWGKWKAQQLFAIDIDNDIEEVGEDGSKTKRILLPTEAGYLDPWDAMARWNCIFDMFPAFMYPSFSFRFDGTVPDLESPDTRMKYRMVLDAGEPVTDAREAASIREYLLKVFPEADQKCSNPNRLFFGSSGKVAWWDAEGVAHYVKRRA